MSRISSRSFWDFGNTAVVMNLGTKGEGEASSRRNILIPQSSEAFMAVRMMCFRNTRSFSSGVASEVMIRFKSSRLSICRCASISTSSYRPSLPPK